MATASSSWSCLHSTSVISETNTSKTIRVTAYWKNTNWTYNINYVSAWVYCNGNKQQVKWDSSLDATSDANGSYSLGYYDYTIAKTTAAQDISCYAKITSNSSYVSGSKYSTATTVSVGAKPYHTVTYNANGGTGAPANQTKWYDESITLSSTIPTKTGHTFVNWCTNTSNTGTKYNPGDTYSSNANVTLYAIWSANTYTITYNANGGTGAPANQTKTYGVDLTLSTTKPTRTNYNFLGWSTSTDGGVVYTSGGTYTNNNAATLYAVWELAYVKPRLTNFSAQRCTSSGAVSESGTYVKVTFDWATDKTLTEIKIEWKTQTGTTWTSSTVTASGTSGSVSQVVGSGGISTETSYVIKASVSDSGGTTPSPTLNIGTIKYPIDVKKGGTGVSIGKAAETDNLFDVALPTKLASGATVTGTVNFNNGNVIINGSTGTIDTAGSINVNDVVSIDSSTGDISTTGNIDATGSVNTTGNINTAGSVNTVEGYKQNDVTFARHSGVNTIISAEDGGNIYLRPNGDSSDTGRVLIKTDGTITAFGGSTRIYGAKVLYNNTSGTTGTITLSETVVNFDYVEIFYSQYTGGSLMASSKVQAPSGKTARLGYDTGSYIYYKDISLSGTSLTIVKNNRVTISSGASDTTEYIYIYKIVGYK